MDTAGTHLSAGETGRGVVRFAKLRLFIFKGAIVPEAACLLKTLYTRFVSFLEQ